MSAPLPTPRVAGGLRPASDDDLATMLRWRNHPQVRAVSITTHEISPAEHEAWWRRASVDSKRKVLIFNFKGTDCGVVNFVEIDETDFAASEPPVGLALQWGFYLDIETLEATGALMPAWISLEKAAIDYAFDQLGAASLGGETLAENRAVLDLHKRFRFQAVRSDVREMDGVSREVIYTELRSTDRR